MFRVLCLVKGFQVSWTTCKQVEVEAWIGNGILYDLILDLTKNESTNLLITWGCKPRSVLCHPNSVLCFLTSQR